MSGLLPEGHNPDNHTQVTLISIIDAESRKYLFYGLFYFKMAWPIFSTFILIHQ